ncbi:MAG TPA: pyrroline-5-carboxylate reductase [Patescibacteria group bacterium]|nr:pyrroline-5-carboxylate reductase [Patescibacteria group bacterium]
MRTITFIGGGNMARSLIGGLIARGHAPSRIRVAEPVEALREGLSRDFSVSVFTDNRLAANGTDLIVLAVKPQVMGTVCLGIADLVAAQDPLIVSIAAGIRLDDFRSWLGDRARLVRTMPNTPALIGAGVTGMYADASVSVEARALAEGVLAAAGPTVWIDDEALMDAVTAVSGSGPAYFFLLMESMIAAAVKQGLPPDTARALVLNTALGAARMAVEGGDEPATLRVRVTSPGGTTQAALARFEAGGFRELVDAAIACATARGRELSNSSGG